MRGLMKTSKDKVRLLKSILTVIILSFIVTFFMILVASQNGTGYQGSVEILFQGFNVPGHPCRGVIFAANINLTFSPMLYPISHITKNGSILLNNCSFTYYPQIGTPHNNPSPDEMEMEILNSLVFSEITWNLPYFFFVGSIIGVLTLITLRTIKSRILKSHKTEK